MNAMETKTTLENQDACAGVPFEKIYLQWDGEDEPDRELPYEKRGEVSWCQDKIFKHDVQYVRADKYEKLCGIIARNAMQRLKGEDAAEMYVTADDIRESLEVLYEWQRNHPNESSDR